MRRVLTLTLTFGLVATACSTAADQTTTGGSTTTTPDPGSDDTGAFGPDVVVSVSSTGGDSADSGNPEPDFQMHRDGSVYVGGSGRFGIDRYQLSDRGVDFVRELFADTPTDADAYGDVDWTDLGTTTIHLNLDGGPRSVSIYGLEGPGDPDDLGRSGPNARQAEARLALLDLLAELDELSEVAGGTADPRISETRQPYTPEAFTLTLLPVVDSDGRILGEAVDRILDGAVDVDERILRRLDELALDPDDDPLAPLDVIAPVEWPLDAALTARPLRVFGGPGTRSGKLCTTMRGPDATQLEPLIEQAGEQSRPWATGADPGSEEPTVVQVAVLSLLPGDEGCEAHGNHDALTAGPFSPVTLPRPESWDGALDADRFEPANPLTMYAAAPLLAAGLEEQRVPGPLDCETIIQVEDAFDPDAYGAVPEGACVEDRLGNRRPTSPGIPTGADLTLYTYEVIVAVVGDTHYLDVEASLIEGYPVVPPGLGALRPDRWRARVDLTEGSVTSLELG